MVTSSCHIITQELTDRDSKGGKSSEDESRLRQQLTARVQELEARLSSSSSALSAEVAELARRVRSANSAGASKNQWESLLEDYRRETGRRIAGMEEQLQAVKSRLDRMDERLGGRMGESNDSLMKEIQERLEAISQRLGQTEGHVTDLKSKNAAVNDGVHRNSDQITALMEDLSLRVGSEIAGRVQDTDSIRVELERLKASSSVGGGDSSGLKRELEECQALVRKLAEVVQTVKTVLGMKIQSEQKLRMAELKGMQEEMKQHSGKLDQLASKVNGKK
uniref:CAP-Gly domain-containing linker protein 1-like n=2 Tax=Macrostomum lignano TaxID=282301 RepID=A0A1I8H5M7_9PLAT